MKLIFTVIGFFLLPLGAFAWSAAGHEMGGAIAYWYLKANKPEAIAKVVSILEKHPWYGKEWDAKLFGLKGEQKEIGLFMLASIFPDEARRTPFGSGEKTKWHYINYQFKPSNLPTPPQDTLNAENKLKELILGISGKTGEEQALDLCWIFHILEDLHQPLHTTAMFDQFHLAGDKGGNDTWFTFKEEGKPIRLHSFWDGLLKGSFDTIPDKAKQLYESSNYAEKALVELKQNPKISDWVKNESVPLAISKAYLNGTINGIEEAATLVPISYKTESIEIAERRVVLSGIRLGKTLAGLFGA